jgi:hypothetical protein
VDVVVGQVADRPPLGQLVGGHHRGRHRGHDGGRPSALVDQRPSNPPLLHGTHSAACGMARSRALAIGCPHRSQMP